MNKGVEQTMEGYCEIEDKMTMWKRLPNGKWICMSPNCSMIRGQHKKLPKKPKLEKINYLERLR